MTTTQSIPRSRSHAVDPTQSIPRSRSHAPWQWFRRSALFILIAVLALIWAGVPATTTTVHAAGAVGAIGATPPPPGTVVHAASCEQAPSQSVKDRATYTPAELARYGLPPQTPGEPFAKWAKMVRVAGKRVCDYTTSSDRWWVLIKSEGWAGYVADESTSGQNYTEADMDYYVPCTSTTTTPLTHDAAAMSAWIGLGGNQDDPNLIQTGTAAFQTYDDVQGWHTQYRTFVENVGYASDPDAHYFFDVSCPTHMYVKVWGGDCMFLLDINNGVNTGNQCYGTNTSGLSAEAIVERSPDFADYPYFADFSSVMFYGVGITDNSAYKAMYQAPHDKDQPYFCVHVHEHCNGDFTGDPFATVSDIFSDPNNPPYDKYNITWQQYGPPPPSSPSIMKGGSHS